MALDWIPVGRTDIAVDDEGPKEHQVVGLTAFSEGEQYYEIWPVDPGGTPSDGWKLPFDNGRYVEDLGVFADQSCARDRAQYHREGQQEPGDEDQA